MSKQTNLAKLHAGDRVRLTRDLFDPRTGLKLAKGMTGRIIKFVGHTEEGPKYVVEALDGDANCWQADCWQDEMVLIQEAKKDRGRAPSPTPAPAGKPNDAPPDAVNAKLLEAERWYASWKAVFDSLTDAAQAKLLESARKHLDAVSKQSPLFPRPDESSVMTTCLHILETRTKRKPRRRRQ